MRLPPIAGALLALVVMATPVAAEHKDSHNPGGRAASSSKHDENDRDKGVASDRFDADDVEDCEDEAKNHGQYVSCVTHLVKAEGRDEGARSLGFDGDDCDEHANLVACAAHQDVGKDDEDEDED